MWRSPRLGRPVYTLQIPQQSFQGNSAFYSTHLSKLVSPGDRWLGLISQHQLCLHLQKGNLSADHDTGSSASVVRGSGDVGGGAWRAKRPREICTSLQASPILVSSDVGACKTGWAVGGKAGLCGCLLAPTPTSHSINSLHKEGRGLRQIWGNPCPNASLLPCLS